MPKTRANGIDLCDGLHGPANAPLLVLNNGILMNNATSWKRPEEFNTIILGSLSKQAS